MSDRHYDKHYILQVWKPATCSHRNMYTLLAGADMERAYQGPCECQGGVLSRNLVLAQYHW